MERYTVGSVRPRGQGQLQTYQLIKDNLQHLTALLNPLGAIQAATISWLLLLLQAFLQPYPSISVPPALAKPYTSQCPLFSYNTGLIYQDPK